MKNKQNTLISKHDKEGLLNIIFRKDKVEKQLRENISTYKQIIEHHRNLIFEQEQKLSNKDVVIYNMRDKLQNKKFIINVLYICLFISLLLNSILLINLVL